MNYVVGTECDSEVGTARKD